MGEHKPRPVPAKWNKFVHLLPYYLNNSPDGLEEARGGAIDLDLHVTKDGVAVNVHDRQPLLHGGFHDPKGRLPKNAKIDDYSWSTWRRVRTEDGHRIHSARWMIKEAGRRGVKRIELEGKDSPGLNDPAVWATLRGVADRAGVDVQMKALTNLPAWRSRTRAASKSMPTIALPRGDRKIPKSMKPYITYYRGRPVWV